MIQMNNYGHYYIILSKQEKLDAIKRWGSIAVAALKLDVDPETVRNGLYLNEYEKWLRKPAVITAEFNHYVMRAW